MKDAVEKRGGDILKIEKRINEIVDRIYKDFSESVGVANIREYEENQLKVTQQLAQERFNLSEQLAKLTQQYGYFLPYISTVIIHKHTWLHLSYITAYSTNE